MEKSRVFSTHHQTHGKKGESHGEQTQKSHFPVKEEQHNNSGNRRHYGPCQIGKLMGQQIFGESGIVVDQLPQPSRLVPGEKAQRQFQYVIHGGAPDIPCRAEGGDMSGHQRCKIQDNTADRSPYRGPAPAVQTGRPVKVRP